MVQSLRPWKEAFKQTIRHGPFAYIYWITVAVGAIASVASLWSPQAARSVVGAVTFAAIVVLIVARYALAAARVKRTDHRPSPEDR